MEMPSKETRQIQILSFERLRDGFLRGGTAGEFLTMITQRLG
ncbi:hypothetical protein BRCON_0240 [Candidatus Sumerlaea chitinivorans]|jgi:hypothetical protein|uniref:Uncharacterized protein n=1 Tax=Sumerlaea chitinivorans TaxID=2250252 RepID=A0A2Z4Y1E9_SUMC1|nr:hypothetical protein BRCON_0240 [Candidatus Sumerlaea chitinivorans]